MKFYKVTIHEMGVGAWIFRGHTYMKGESYHEVMNQAFINQRPFYPMSKIGIDADEVTEAEYKANAIQEEDLPF
jgi:hypothetical protein